MNDLRLEVSVDDQLFRGDELVRTFVISTARKGVGSTPGSHRTPTGRFVIVQKIGDGMPEGTIFKSREPVGQWQPGEACDKDLVLTRIIRISGLEPDNANSFDRFIYFHGTNREDLLGTPASCGCIRLSNRDVIELHDLVEPGMKVVILPPSRKRGKLIFCDCDSTQLYLDTIFPGVLEVIAGLKADGWTPVIISGGFAPLIAPLAKALGIDHVEAVPLHFDIEGNYAGYGSDYPTTRNGGKPEIIREWKSALLPEVVVMVGDGISDLESKPEVDLFVGFGGVIAREAVRKGAGA